jgi:hypothetical protein
VGAIVTTGGVVRTGERAENVIVMPAGALGPGTETAFEGHGEMAWVGIE